MLNVPILLSVLVYRQERETPVRLVPGHRVPQRDQWPEVRVPRVRPLLLVLSRQLRCGWR